MQNGRMDYYSRISMKIEGREWTEKTDIYSMNVSFIYSLSCTLMYMYMVYVYGFNIMKINSVLLQPFRT